jgi:hypothetical protein
MTTVAHPNSGSKGLARIIRIFVRAITNMFKLVDQVREATQRLRYSIRTEAAYVLWVKRFALFYGKRHPLERGEPHVMEFLTHLAVHEHVTPPRELRPSVPSCPTSGGEERLASPINSHDPSASLFRQNSANTGHAYALLIPYRCHVPNDSLTEKERLSAKQPFHCPHSAMDARQVQVLVGLTRPWRFKSSLRQL